MSSNNIEVLPTFEISVIVSNKDDGICIELRRTIKEVNTIKKVLSCAAHGQPIICTPVFKDKVKSLNSLVEKGILYKDKDNSYYFNI